MPEPADLDVAWTRPGQTADLDRHIRDGASLLVVPATETEREAHARPLQPA